VRYVVIYLVFIKVTTKLRFLGACIFPMAMYGCETWILCKAAEKSINAFECKCYRRILRITWTEKRTNMSTT